MSSRLGEERVREVSRLREKIQEKNLSQLGQLRSLKQLPHEALIQRKSICGSTKTL